MVEASYAGSNALAKQIENGRQPIFLSADESGWTIATRKLVVTATRRDLVIMNWC